MMSTTLSPFGQTLLDYIRAGYPAIAVVTHEEERLLADIRTLRGADWSYAVWTMTRGWTSENDRVNGVAAGDPVRAIQSLASLPERTLAITLDLHPYFGQAPEVVRAIRDVLELAKSTKRPLLLCSPDLRLPIELQKDIALLDYPLPTLDTVGQLLGELLDTTRKSLPAPLISQILRAARGLTWNEAENAFALALIRNAEQPEEMPATVRHEKTSLVRKQGLLEIIDPSEDLESVGGLEPLKHWLTVQGALLTHAAEALAWGFRPQDLPKGVLLVGVPGTGKSLIARAIAASWNLTLLRLEMPRILGSLYGQSESQTAQALRLADAMAPVVLHIDEIEKALAGATGGAHDSVSPRVVGQILTWLQERGLGPEGGPAPVFVVATANRIDRLPPELFRPGRFDQVFFLDLPDGPEQLDVLRIHLAKRRQHLPDTGLTEVIRRTEKFSPAELEQVVKNACLEAFRDNKRTVRLEDLVRAAQSITPLAESRAEEITAIREWARTRAQRANATPTAHTARRALEL